MVDIKLMAITTFTVCWYWSSSINAVATQRLLRQFVDPEQDSHDEEESSSTPVSLALMLTSSQLVVGSMLSIIILFVMGQLGFTDDKSIVDSYKNWRRSDIIIGLFHYFGCLCTNIGFAYGSASLVQVIKLLEPIETMILAVLVHIASSNGGINSIGEVVSVQKVLATLVIIGGTSMLLGQNSMALNSRSIIAALASGFCMSSRNVLKKRAGATKRVGDLPRAESSNVSSASAVDVFMKGMINFSFITIFAAIPAVVVLFPGMMIGSISPKIFSSFFQGPRLTFIQAVIFHCFYNIASITVLSLTSALVHSLLNVGKRIVNVMTVAVVFGVPLSMPGKVGLMIAAAGTILYNKQALSQLPQISSRSKWVLLFCMLIAPVPFMVQRTWRNHDISTQEAA